MMLVLQMSIHELSTSHELGKENLQTTSAKNTDLILKQMILGSKASRLHRMRLANTRVGIIVLVGSTSSP